MSPLPPPSASPSPVWLTLALLLCLLVQVTSLQRPASDLLTSPSTVPPSHTEDAVPRQTFGGEGEDTTLQDSSLLPVHSTLQDTTTSGDTMKGLTEILQKILTKETEQGTRRQHLQANNNLSNNNNNTYISNNNFTSGPSLTDSSPDSSPDSTPDSLSGPGRRARRDYLATYEVNRPARQRSGTALRLNVQGPMWMDHKTLIVELVVLADRSMYQHYGSVPGVENHVKKVVSVANGFLNRVGVVVVLTEVKVWKRNQINMVNNFGHLLNAMMDYRPLLMKEEPQLPNDNMFLLTRIEFQGKTVGKALTGEMCREKTSVGVVSDRGDDYGKVGHILAHELGHNLGMKHDNVAQKILGQQCHCSTDLCIMHHGVSATYDPKLAWNSCSRKFIDNMLETTALDCLKNVPTTVFISGSCGDGVVDPNAGEQCDCGPVEFCDNRCCVAATCRLAVNASCATGSCCDTQTCEPKESGNMCRAASSDCDLPEYCSGHSEYCPDDVHKKDGVTCRWGKGHCHQGGCGSHEGRCEHVWGINAQVAHHKCYSNFNSKGNGDGNCGKHPKYDQYLPCTPKTQHCGTLHCVPPSYSKTRFDDPHHNSTDQVDGHTCSFIIAYEAYPAQDWLSPDGAACGTDKMCINQKCVMIPSAGGDCAGGCSGHGVCNNLDHCHCDPGYSPPSCLFPGTGGSIDSGAVSEAQDYSGVITASWVLVTLVVTVLVIMCCFWGYIRRWWERWGRGCVSPKLPCCASCIDTCCCPIMTKFTRWLVTVGSSREKNRSVKKEIHTGDAEEGVDEAMVCSVDVDFKGISHTNSWGVADQKLVTDVITITPKNSPDLRRKIQLPSNSPVLHRKSVDSLDRPNYFQSVSVDSGCVSDSDEGISGKHSSVHMSMTSLISAFRRFNTKRGTTPPENDSRRSKNLGSLKSMPLSRFVVDPLAGSRSSRQVTPPPDHMKHGFRRSISTDVTRGRHGGAPPPPPPSLKPHKSDDNLITSNKLANNHFLSSENGNIHKINSGTQSGSRSHHSSDDGSGVDSQAVRKPIMPFKKSLSPLKPSPPLPPLAKSKPYTASVGKNSATNGQNGNINRVPLKPPQIMTSNNQLRTGGSATNNTTNSGNTTKKKNVLDMARKFEAL